MINCFVCGKFISYNDIESEKVDVHFQPDNEYTSEDRYFSHKECENKDKK
jgi:hypothetical protein